MEQIIDGDLYASCRKMYKLRVINCIITFKNHGKYEKL